MLTINELASLLTLSKERAKQLINDEVALNPEADVDRGTVWKIGPKTIQKLLASRGLCFP